jgi:hypothetical protein
MGELAEDLNVLFDFVVEKATNDHLLRVGVQGAGRAVVARDKTGYFDTALKWALGGGGEKHCSNIASARCRGAKFEVLSLHVTRHVTGYGSPFVAGGRLIYDLFSM